MLRLIASTDTYDVRAGLGHMLDGVESHLFYLTMSFAWEVLLGVIFCGLWSS